MWVKFKCLVHGAIGPEARRTVELGLAQVAVDHFALPPTAVTVEFTEIADGRWFTAGRPSEASMVLSSVPAGTSQAMREAVMADICSVFSTATGTRYDDIMVVAADPATSA